MAARKSSYGKLAHMAQKVQGIDWASDASLVEADEQFARCASAITAAAMAATTAVLCGCTPKTAWW